MIKMFRRCRYSLRDSYLCELFYVENGGQNGLIINILFCIPLTKVTKFFVQSCVNYPFKKIPCNGIYIGVGYHFLVICSLTFTSLLGLLPCTPAKHLHLCVFLLGWSSWLRVPVPAGLHGKTLRSAAKQVCQLPLPEWWTLPFTSHGL